MTDSNMIPEFYTKHDALMLAISRQHVGQNCSEFSSDIGFLRKAFEDSWTFSQISAEEHLARAPVKDLLKACLYRHIQWKVNPHATEAGLPLPVNPVLDTLLVTSRAFLSLIKVSGNANAQEREEWNDNINHVLLLSHHLLVAYSPIRSDMWCPHRRVRHFAINIAQTWFHFMNVHLRGYLEHCPMPWSRKSQDALLERYGTRTPAAAGRLLPFELLSRFENYPAIIHVPDMPWLGGKHRGYPRCASLGEYTWIRWSRAMTEEDERALWQSAMTFGVFEVIGPWEITEDMFLHIEGDHATTFTFKHVNALLIHLLDYIRNEDVRLTQARAQRVYAALYNAYLALEEAFGEHDHGVFRESRDDPVLMKIFTSIATMLQGFLRAIYRVAGEGSHDFLPVPKAGWVSIQQTSLFYEEQLEKLGWCPSIHVDQLLQWGALGCMHNPPVRTSKDEHSRCMKARCMIAEIDTKNYIVHHTTPGCSCSFIHPPLPVILAHLSTGRVPVVYYDGTRINVRSADDGPYVAISHVWVDGLGSSSDIGLPKCQVERIAAFASELLGCEEAAFWIDGLCIPLDPEPRNDAIRLMADTYQRSETLLVFDAGIRTLCSSSRPLEENLFRISTSAWVNRVWTLQEALLPKDICFEFSNNELVQAKYLREGALEARFAAGQWWYAYSPLLADVEAMNSLRTLIGSRAEQCPTHTLSDISSLLSLRTSNRPEDEAFAVAGLLGIDVNELIKHPDRDARMRAFFLSIRTIPASVIFQQRKLRRLPGKPFRWAPHSLTSLGALALDASGAAVCALDGLTTDLRMDIFHFPEQPLSVEDMKQVFAFDSSKGELHLVAEADERSECSIATFNAFVGPPGTFEGGPKHGVVWIVAVNIVDSPSRVSHDSSDPEPITCEFGVVAGVTWPEGLSVAIEVSENGQRRLKREILGDILIRVGCVFTSRVTMI